MLVYLQIQKRKMKIVDQFNRSFDYLRIGVTDRCNLRCTYCMPAEGIDLSTRKDLMSYEEIIQLAKIFRSLGVTKVRLTGGEPFVRKDIMKLLRELTIIFPKVHITSNATMIGSFIPELKEIGIAGINISIDTIQKDKFEKITRRDQFDGVMKNIISCCENRIPIKLNIVAMKGVNDDEIIDLIDFGSSLGIETRFIESMPFNGSGDNAAFLSAKDILQKIKEHYSEVIEIRQEGKSSSLRYLVGSKSMVGIIPAYSRSLCGMCNRIRLTPKGELMNCLYSNSGFDLLSELRDPIKNDLDITEIIQSVFWKKPKDGFEAEKDRKASSVYRSMTTIGG